MFAIKYLFINNFHIYSRIEMKFGEYVINLLMYKLTEAEAFQFIIMPLDRI